MGYLCWLVPYTEMSNPQHQGFPYLAMDQYLLIPFLGEWTSIYQLFWCELQGYKVLTHYHLMTHFYLDDFGVHTRCDTLTTHFYVVDQVQGRCPKLDHQVMFQVQKWHTDLGKSNFCHVCLGLETDEILQHALFELFFEFWWVLLNLKLAQWPFSYAPSHHDLRSFWNKPSPRTSVTMLEEFLKCQTLRNVAARFNITIYILYLGKL